MPQAENTEASAGTTTLVTPSSCGERHRVHRAAAAERDQREVARVEPPVERDQLERVDHVVVRDPNDTGGRLVRAEAEPATDLAQHRFHGSHVRVHLRRRRSSRG